VNTKLIHLLASTPKTLLAELFFPFFALFLAGRPFYFAFFDQAKRHSLEPARAGAICGWWTPTVEQIVTPLKCPQHLLPVAIIVSTIPYP
jgi:hypothetical protein